MNIDVCFFTSAIIPAFVIACTDLFLGVFADFFDHLKHWITQSGSHLNCVKRSKITLDADQNQAWFDGVDQIKVWTCKLHIGTVAVATFLVSKCYVLLRLQHFWFHEDETKVRVHRTIFLSTTVSSLLSGPTPSQYFTIGLITWKRYHVSIVFWFTKHCHSHSV